MTTKTQTIQERAQWHIDNFERGKRESELPTDGKIWVLKDRTAVTSGDSRGDHPTTELVRNAHRDPDGDQMMPDDWRYEYIVDALYLIAETDGDADWDELGWTIEGDVYNSNLTTWLSSHLYRASYCDAAAAELEIASDATTFDRIMAGNAYEQRFVYESVLHTIRTEIA